MTQQWFLIKVPSKRGFNEFVGGYRFVHGVLPLLRSCGALRLLSSDDKFETLGRRQATPGEYFFQLNTISVEFGLFWKLQETIRECSDIAKNCFTDESYRVERALTGVRVSRSAGIGQYYRDKSQICGVTYGRLNADFECDTDDGDTRNIGIA
jgi:hypothetical protein